MPILTGNFRIDWRAAVRWVDEHLVTDADPLQIAPIRIDGGRRAAPGTGMIECRLDPLRLGFQSAGTLPQDVIQFDNAILDGAVSRFMRSRQDMQTNGALISPQWCDLII